MCTAIVRSTWYIDRALQRELPFLLLLHRLIFRSSADQLHRGESIKKVDCFAAYICDLLVVVYQFLWLFIFVFGIVLITVKTTLSFVFIGFVSGFVKIFVWIAFSCLLFVAIHCRLFSFMSDCYFVWRWQIIFVLCFNSCDTGSAYFMLLNVSQKRWCCLQWSLLIPSIFNDILSR